MEGYTQVDQSWIDYYIDGFTNIKDEYGKNIVFYRKYDETPIKETLNNNNIYKYKSKMKFQGYNEPPKSEPGSALFIKNEDYNDLETYIIEQKEKKEKEQAIRDAKRKEDEEDNIRKNTEQINKTKEYILNTILDSQLLSEGDKESLVNNVTNNDIEEYFTLSNEHDQNFIFERVVRLLHNSITNMTNIFSSIQSIFLPEIDNENIELKRIVTKNDRGGFITTYTIKIKTPHIIFYYDIKTQQFTLCKMIIGKEYTIEDKNDSFIIHTEPLIYVSKPIKHIESKYLFYIYKVEANTVLDSDENALRPFNQNLNVAPNVQNVEQRQTSCFGRACETFRRYARINPGGGKRTHKQKKTRKHKKAHRKMIQKRNNTIVQKLNFRNKR